MAAECGNPASGRGNPRDTFLGTSRIHKGERVMSDKFTFSSAGLVHELELAMDRAGGYNAGLVKRMCQGDHLVHIREYLLGHAEVKMPKLAAPGDKRTMSPLRVACFAKRIASFMLETVPRIRG